MHNNSAASNSYRDLVLANYGHCSQIPQMYSGKGFDLVTSSPPPAALKSSLEAPFDGRLLLPPKKAGKSVGSALHRRSSDYIDFSHVNSNSVDRNNKKLAAKEIQIPATITSTGTTGTVQNELMKSSQHHRNVASCENLYNAAAGWASPEMHINESLHGTAGKKSSRKLKFLPKFIPNWFRKRKSSCKNEKGEEVFISVQNLPNLRNRSCTINNSASLEKLYEASRHEMTQQEVSEACCFSNHSRTPPLHPIGAATHSGGVNCSQQQQTSYQPLLFYSSSPPPFNEYMPVTGGGGGTGSRASHAQNSRKASTSHSIYHQHSSRVSPHSRENSLPLSQMENVLYYPVFSSGVVEKLVPYYMGAAIHTSDFLEQHRSSANGRQIHYISHVRGDPILPNPATAVSASNVVPHKSVNTSSQCRHPKGQGHRSRSVTHDPPMTSCGAGAANGQMVINDYHPCPVQQQQQQQQHFFPHPTSQGAAAGNGDRHTTAAGTGATYSSRKEILNTLTNVTQLQSSVASVTADDVIAKRVTASQFLDNTCIQDNSTVVFNSNNLAPFEGSSRRRRNSPYHHSRQNETSPPPRQQQQGGEQPKEQQRVLSMENSIAATNNQSVSSSPEHKSSGYATLDTANSLMVNHSTPRVNQLQALNSQSASSNRLNQSKSPSTKMIQSQCTTPTPTTKNKHLRIPLNDIHKQGSKPHPLGDNLESKCTQTNDYYLKSGQNNNNNTNHASTSTGAPQLPIPVTNPNFRLRKLSVTSANNANSPNSPTPATGATSKSNQVKSYFDFSSFSVTPPESMQMTIQQPVPTGPGQFDKHLLPQATTSAGGVQQSTSQESHIIYGQSTPGSPNLPARTLKAPTIATITSNCAVQNSPLWTRRKVDPPCGGVTAGKDHDYSTITSKMDATLQPRASFQKKDASSKGNNSFQDTSQSFYRSFEQDLRKLNNFFDSQGVSDTVMKRFRKRSLSKFPSDVGSIPSLNEPRPQPVGPYVLSQHGLAENQLINPPMTEFDKTLLVLNWLMHCQKEIKLEKVCYF